MKLYFYFIDFFEMVILLEKKIMNNIVKFILF